MRHLKLNVVLIFATISQIGHLQMMETPEWKTEVQESTIAGGDTITVLFTAKIPQDWYMYSSDFDPNVCPMVTEFNFNESKQFERSKTNRSKEKI